MDQADLIPPEHAHLIRGCGVGFGSHLFLPSHIGADPVVVVQAGGDSSCSCCGDRIPSGEPVLEADYERTPIHLHATHCERDTARATRRSCSSVEVS